MILKANKILLFTIALRIKTPAPLALSNIYL
ncbi:hypothetical protein Krac_1184 [Ktedonobacter racemifer DSM 44963]|uniref:Uncharacterized protein n=1 Tax=Ktedonobacter racemifer DSM 44963 TaxID=485913 RepID=D6U6F8_KTERA|nr:hypothetical protein Krac_1184 [Ktedonobacter racemifer DSM 44963]